MIKRGWLIRIGGIMILAMLGFLIFQYHEFHHSGIEQPLVDDLYDYYSQEWKNTVIDYKVVDVQRLIVSKMYMHENEDEVQIRFRFAYQTPFSPENLFFDTRWEIRDAEGNQYEGKLTLYSQMVKSIETVNAVLRMTGEEYSRLSGKELEITFYCTQGEDYESYAHGKLAVKLP